LSLAAIGCDNGTEGPTCGPGTVLNTTTNTCDDVPGPAPITCGPNAMLSADGKSCYAPDFAGTAPTCGGNTTLDPMTNTCKITAAACLDGTVLDTAANTCKLNVDHGSLVAGPFVADKVWSFLRYSNGTSLQPLGNGFSRTATVAANTEIYMGNAPSGGNFDPATTPRMGHAPVDTTSDSTRVVGGWDVYWDANANTPSSTPSAFDHYITVGEWDTCTMTWSVYSNPPNIGGKKYYRLVVDLAGCPPSSSIEMWFQYGNGANGASRILGTPAGGLPNSTMVTANGTAHWERDFDPNVWTKSNVALNGNTHAGGGFGNGTQGRTPDLSTNPLASFWLAAFWHNSGQSNGNAGWCAPPDGVASNAVAITCGIPDYIGKTKANTGNATGQVTNVKPYIYLPGKVGAEASPVFGGGATPNVVNAAPLANLQPY